MKKILRKNHLRVFLTALLLFAACMLLPVSASDVQAKTETTTGFTTISGKTYYIKKDGSKQKGWLTLNGKKYYFNTKTGVQLKGWQTDSSGKKIRYFTKGQGYMVTGFLTDSNGNTRYFNKEDGLMVRGWMTDSQGNKYYFSKGAGVMAKGWLKDSKDRKRYFSKASGRMLTGWQTDTSGNTRYFDKSTGIMDTGLKRISGYYYYFSKTTGVRYQKGFGTTGGKKYYFNPENGRAQTGWLELDGKKYYFDVKGVMYVSTTATISGQTYLFDADGVATVNKYVLEGDAVKVYDNGRNYYLRKEFLEHPGVATGEVSDLDLLAALVEAEAGDQGKVGMEAVALCVLNRTIKPDKEFPSSIRYVIYMGKDFPQYSVVSGTSLLKRLQGQFYNKTLAYEAASEAMEIFEKYVTDGTPRKLPGFKADFNYMYFMMESSFYQMPNLDFKRVESFLYKDHMFFVDWVVPSSK
ncbi:MAG: cell wall hydrolase [Eubacteriales bacterium]|nr:cell wall hydrolase [Eubacteriales bacterium]